MNKSDIETVIKSERVTKDGATYCYTLLMSESTKVASYRIPLYSIAIDMTDENGKKTNAHSPDLFADVGKALVFFRKLIDNLATPLNLPYILEDEMH
jgi:hypothetical protein